MKSLKLGILFILLFTLHSVFAQPESAYFFSKTVEGSFEEVTTNLKAVLKEQGFGVITEIDMASKLKESLKDVELRPYKIIGVCNPSFAYQTIKLEENIGIFLPCKAIIKDVGEGKVEVVVANPTTLMGILNNEDLTTIAEKVSEKLKAALDNL